MQTTVTEPTPVGVADRLRAWLPRGQTLDDRAFAERHRTLSILLALHVPVLFVFGILNGQAVLHALGEVSLAGLMVGLAQSRAVPRRVKGILVSAGLVWCSAVLVHFSGGLIEAHFHFFIILGFIALYQDWAAFGWAIVFTALSHGLGSTLAPDLMFNHTSAVDRPWTWALIHAGAVLFAATGQIIGWRHAEAAQDRATALNTQLIREQAERQASYSRIYVNLARRNQSLLHRQVAVIDDLERTEEDPEVLRRLFTLDHLTTRIRRNAESLLVMAGEDSPRQVAGAVSLADIVRAAASEIEQYARTDIRVAGDYALAGGAVVDVTHLLAELVENATEYSSPNTSVLISSQPTANGVAIVVIDQGIGMSPEDLAAANSTLTSPPELDDQIVRHLGFQVVGRLAAKLGLRVLLQPTPGGGTTAVVELPTGMLVDGSEPAPPPAPPVPAPTAAAPPAPVAPAATATPTAPAAPVPLVSAPAATPAAAAVAATPIAPPPSPLPPDVPVPAAATPAPGDLLFTASRPPSGRAASAAAPVAAATATNGAPPPVSAVPPVTVTPSALPTTPGGLPRRTPAASLTPELRQPVTAPAGGEAAVPAPEARRALSAFQAASRAGRDPGTDGANGEVRS